MKAYLTLLSTENYLKGVLVLHKSLIATNTSYPLVVVLSERISTNTEQILQSHSIQTLRINNPLSVNIPNDINSETVHWSYTFEKLHIFGLTQFEKIVFLDSDMLVLENIDELFEKKHLSAVCAGAKYPGNEDWKGGLNSGLLVIEPNTQDYKNLIKLVPSVTQKLKNCGDQDVIKAYVAGKYTEDFWLDDKYNMFQIYLDWHIENQNYTFRKQKSPNNIKIVHFITGSKPWMRRTNLMSNLIFSVKSAIINILPNGSGKKYYRQVLGKYRNLLREYDRLR